MRFWHLKHSILYKIVYSHVKSARACLSSNTGLNLSFCQPVSLHAQSAMETCSRRCLHLSWRGWIFSNKQVLFQTCCWRFPHMKGICLISVPWSLVCGMQPVPLFKSCSNISSFRHFSSITRFPNTVENKLGACRWHWQHHFSSFPAHLLLWKFSLVRWALQIFLVSELI